MSLIDGLRRLLPLAGRASLELRTGVAANRFRLFSAQSPKEKTHGNLHYDQKVTTLEEEIPDAPGMFQTVGAMGAGGKVNHPFVHLFILSHHIII